MDGICTLANDRVFDQLVALLNSIEANVSRDIPVCIYPFDDKLDRIRKEIQHRPNVMIYEDQDSIRAWDEFMQRIAPERIDQKMRLYGAHRRFCAFDAPFDRFIYMDADTLAMSSMDHIFERLNNHDWVVYDFQFLDPSKIYNLDSPKLYEVFPKERIDKEIFCSGFFAAKRGLFNSEQRETLIEQLLNGDREILYGGAGEQPVINYMVMKSGIKACNVAHLLPFGQSTGCSITSKHFEEKDHVLYDRGLRLTYLHYIGIKPQRMEQVCQGIDGIFPYRDVFLHYRFLHQPEQRPILTAAPKPTLVQKVLQKLKRA